LHVPDRSERVAAWRPEVPGVAEVLHARFVVHAYPPHTHDVWTLLIVDAGAIRFDLDHREHGAIPAQVTLLPPHLAHTGRSGTDGGFVKRVVYLETSVLAEELITRVVRSPELGDPLLRRRIAELHGALGHRGDELEAESRLALIRDRLHRHLVPGQPRTPPSPGLAGDLRDLLDARLREGLTLREAGRLLHAHPDSLVRVFTAAFGLPPHRYLTGRRVEAARRLLLDGEPAATVATAVGFHDQAHLTRHFTRLLGSTPGRYALSGRERSAAVHSSS
jgi:AraC-like DNA-binding protein